MADTQKIKLFISYSHKDKELCNELQNHLSPLRLDNSIESWQDRELLPGDAWDEEIKRNLRESDIVVFLLSSDLLASTYIIKNEISIAYEKHKKGELIIVPIMLRKCLYQRTLFNDIQGLPTPFEPITSSKWPSRDEYFYEIVVGLERFIDSVKERREKEEKEKEEKLRREKEQREREIRDRDRIERERRDKERKEKEEKEQDEIVRQEIERADGYYFTNNYDAAFPIYYKYRDHKLFSSDNQVSLGFMYGTGNGVTKDYSEAVKWYRKAAEQGNASGQNNLGVMYEKGDGVTKDYSEAVKWYRKSSDQGNAFGQSNLGVMFRDGYGVTKDYNEAVKWFRKAAEQGNANGLSRLGWMYENGKGVEKDPNKAKELYLSAAKQGHKYAQKACTRLNVKW